MSFPLHLAPNVPWLIFVPVALALIGLAFWAYTFRVPPLRIGMRRLLTVARAVALLLLLFLLMQPVLERPLNVNARVVVLDDRSNSMDLPSRPRGPSRREESERAIQDLRRALGGRATLDVRPFGRTLGGDSLPARERGATALGDALDELARGGSEELGSVVVVSDGAVNAGQDPVAAARALGVPVHSVRVGEEGLTDRAVSAVESSTEAQVGRPVPVRATITSSEPAGRSIAVRLLDGRREIGRTTVTAPGSGAEVTAEFRVAPERAGLAVWTAAVDSLEGEITAINNERQVAIEVAPGRIEVAILSGGPNWDLAFLRRALAGDSALAISVWTKERDGWRGPGRKAAPLPADLGGKAVLILDAVAPFEVSREFDAASGDFVRRGGAAIAIGGPLPGIGRFRGGAFADGLPLEVSADRIAPNATPEPSDAAREMLQWDDDLARGDRAWRSAAPLADLVPLSPAAGDRVLLGATGGGPPLFVQRRVGRGQVLLVNGTGFWRWALSGHDDLTAERSRRLWRGLVRTLSEPVQGEPVRVRPERRLTSRGETVRLIATVQDEQFRPLGGAAVQGEITDERGRSRSAKFEARAAGTYEAAFEDLPPGRYRVSARASRGGKELGRATSDLAVDAWSLETAETRPDSAGLAALAAASGGSSTDAHNVGGWARRLDSSRLARGRTESVRLWESPWVFAIVVGLLGVEWAWRRMRGLP